MDEADQIKQRYARRQQGRQLSGKGAFYFDWYHRQEKELKYAEILRKKFGNDYSRLKLMEVGAGTGNSLYFFSRAGFRLKHIWANELLDERFEVLRSNFPSIHIEPGDARLLRHENDFDIVLQSVVFTSILDPAFKAQLANTLFRMVRPGGLILWYDFMYDNPANKDVKGIGKKEIRNLFPGTKSITFTKVTLAPPIGRRVHRFYNFLNLVFPVFRTHLIAEIEK